MVVIPIVLAGLKKAGMVEFVEEVEGFGEEWLVLELFEVEPFPDFGPPRGGRVAKPVAGFQGGFDFVPDVGFGLVDLVDEVVETTIFRGWLWKALARKEAFDFCAKFFQVCFSSGSNDNLGIWNQFLKLLLKDISRFIGAADNENGAVAENLLGSRSSQGE